MENGLNGFFTSYRLTIKGLLVGALILVMMIPALFIFSLVQERKGRQAEVVREVSSKWASAQTLGGPFLCIPYTVTEKTADGKVVNTRKMAYFLPESLRIRGRLRPEMRHRSIFNVIVYTGDLSFEGDFAPLSPASAGVDSAALIPEEAMLCMGLSDFRGIDSELKLAWGEASLPFNAGLPDKSIAEQGVSVPLKLQAGDLRKQHHYSIQMRLKGSEQLYFLPLGKTTEVQLSSEYRYPSFSGNYLPGSSDVRDTGFTASWKILHLNRSYPQEWAGREFDVAASAFGVSLLQTGDIYSRTERSVKYALLFVTLTFLLYFFIEILQKKNVHALQYILVGMAIIVFFTLLLSISEYLGFAPAYLVSSVATISLITAYTRSVFSDWKVVALFSGILSLLYAFIFVLIQLQDGALLFGSIGLFIILALVMYFSRKVEWYARPVAYPDGPAGA